MIIGEEIIKLFGDEGRRFGTDRRKFSYTVHVPERRSGIDRRNQTERREHKRFQVKGLAFAKLWSEYEKDYVQDMGKLLDISRKGLALSCSEKTEKTGEHSGLGIFISGDDLRLDNIPFKIVSDIEMTSDSTLSKESIRRYGIQFKELTPNQSDKLNHFLLNYTSSEA